MCPPMCVREPIFDAKQYLMTSFVSERRRALWIIWLLFNISWTMNTEGTLHLKTSWADVSGSSASKPQPPLMSCVDVLLKKNLKKTTNRFFNVKLLYSVLVPDLITESFCFGDGRTSVGDSPPAKNLLYKELFNNKVPLPHTQLATIFTQLDIVCTVENPEWLKSHLFWKYVFHVCLFRWDWVWIMETNMSRIQERFITI